MSPDELDPCGECPKGQCDHCEGCTWAASFDDNDPDVERRDYSHLPLKEAIGAAFNDIRSLLRGRP